MIDVRFFVSLRMTWILFECQDKCHSERSEESAFLVGGIRKKQILRDAQNDIELLALVFSVGLPPVGNLRQQAARRNQPPILLTLSVATRLLFLAANALTSKSLAALRMT